tara:strand:+ start:632 stop:757 length:126 start_codon:yes stop_codon:yes gene_type:complete
MFSDDIVLEMKDKLIDLGEIDFLKHLEDIYEIDLGLKVEDV